MFENDFIVEFNDEELGECRTYSRNFKGYEQAIKDLKLYKAKQNQRIAELEEQLKNAIVPKFKVGQKVWFIYGKSIRSFIILRTDIEIRDCVLIAYSDRGWHQYEENCFATKEEAQAKLEELKGEKK